MSPSLRPAVLILAVLCWSTGCDHGLAPPEEPPVGSIRGVITYRSAWPPSDSLRDLRFFALPFIPVDTLDLFRDLNQLVFSDRLQMYVERDSFFIEGIQARFYLYSGVAQQFSPNLLAWRPVGLYKPDDGIFLVRPGEVTDVSITVDFNNLPPFPPPEGGSRLGNNNLDP